jgi:hypothetical protein
MNLFEYLLNYKWIMNVLNYKWTMNELEWTMNKLQVNYEWTIIELQINYKFMVNELDPLWVKNEWNPSMMMLVMVLANVCVHNI